MERTIKILKARIESLKLERESMQESIEKSNSELDNLKNTILDFEKELELVLQIGS